MFYHTVTCVFTRIRVHTLHMCICVYYYFISLLLLMREQFLRLSKNLILLDDNSKIGVNLNRFISALIWHLMCVRACVHVCRMCVRTGVYEIFVIQFSVLFLSICIGNSTVAGWQASSVMTMINKFISYHARYHHKKIDITNNNNDLIKMLFLSV